MQNISDFIKEIRQSRNLKQKDIALAMNMSPSYLSHIEFGRKPIPHDFISRLHDVVPLNTIELTTLTKIIANSEKQKKFSNIESIKRELRLIVDKLLLKLSQGISDLNLIEEIKDILNIIQEFFDNKSNDATFFEDMKAI
jgi:transcriptional regulator with XRE-family HTH domain